MNITMISLCTLVSYFLKLFHCFSFKIIKNTLISSGSIHKSLIIQNMIQTFKDSHYKNKFLYTTLK